MMKESEVLNAGDSIIVHHLARCGSHAIIEWLAKSMIENECDSVCHYNNVNHQLEPRNIDKYLIDRRPESEMIESTIYSTENFDLRGYEETFGSLHFDETIFIVRDWRNWLASSLKTPGVLSRPRETHQSKAMEEFGYTKWFMGSMSRLEMYKQYLRELLGETNYVDGDITVIDYDLWFLYDEYRDTIPHGDSSIDTDVKSSYCDYNSFSGSDPTKRWKSMGREVNQLADDELKILWSRGLKEVIKPLASAAGIYGLTSLFEDL